MLTLTKEEISQYAQKFNSKEATPEVLKWAIEKFYPDIALACSFGAEDVALVDMVCKINPDLKIFYLDTDLLFKETYQTIERVKEKYKIQPIAFKSKLTLEEQDKEYGPEIWKQDPTTCCNLRKVEPLKKAFTDLNLKCWITGIRRDQALTRANARLVEEDTKFILIKINPLAYWTSEDVWNYIKQNNVPYNPLHDNNYPSIGCEPCTKQVMPGEDPRSGRWAGFQKTECGLHK